MIEGETAVFEQASQHAVHDRGTDLALDVVADNGQVGVGELFGPHRVRRDEHGYGVHEGDARVNRGLGVEFLGLF